MSRAAGSLPLKTMKPDYQTAAVLGVNPSETVPKDPAAVALGARGGKANSAAQREARRRSLEQSRKKRWPAKQ